MRHFEMRFDTPERLQAALAANPSAVENGDAYVITDPSGIRLRLAKTSTRQLETKQVATKVVLCPNKG